MDACYLIHDKAPGWKPGSAPPWFWAQAAIHQLVIHRVGHRQGANEEGIEGDVSDGQTTAVDLTPETWAILITQHEKLHLLDEALSAAGSDRNRWVFLEYILQQASNDPSPAITVGAMFELTPANVRQIVRRQRLRLQHLAQTNSRFAFLLELPVADAA